jgi:hypothetical protein
MAAKAFPISSQGRFRPKKPHAKIAFFIDIKLILF